jgi:hypothetical protein
LKLASESVAAASVCVDAGVVEGTSEVVVLVVVEAVLVLLDMAVIIASRILFSASS